MSDLMEVSSEARALWNDMFSHPKDGDAVMDGSGVIFRAHEGMWTDGRRVVSPLRLARALCPDLAAEFNRIAKEDQS
jgi:hypothetical protein